MLRVRVMAAALSPQRQAVMWEVRLREGDADGAELRAFERWRGATVDNAQAWDALQERLARMGGGGSRASAAMAHALRVPSTERRRALRAAFGLLALGVGAWGAREGALGLGLDADWRSAVGERGAGVLADGTPLAYDADSRIYLAGSAVAPLLDLRQGQLLLKATPQSAGILTVSTAHGTVVSSGAVLNVGRLRERSVVSVKAGSALLRPAGRAAVPIEAGQTFYFDRHGARASDLSFAAVSAWTRGVFVADRLPLAELLEVFGRYRAGLLRASGKAATQEISGVFRLDDIDGALLQVAAALPVKLTRYGRYVAVFS
jgi:transmembrane sensor